MKIHKILFSALLLTCLVSCEEDAPLTTLEDSQSVEDAANSDGTNDGATVRWSANDEELVSNEPSVSVGGYLTLKDLSEGVVSREWIVSSGDVNSIYFLKGDFKNTTDTSDDSKYDAYIDDETTLSGSSSEAEINLYFKEIGSTTLILRNTYAEPVYKKYEDATDGNQLFAQSVINGDKHVIDIPIIVNVNGEGSIDWSLSSDDTMTEVSELMEYNILVGSEIAFNDLSLWNTSHSWTLDGSGVSVVDGSYAQDNVTLKFDEAGTQTLTLKNYYAEKTTCTVAGSEYTTTNSNGHFFEFPIKINVYAAEVVSDFKVYTDEACSTEVTEDIEIDANTTLYFKDLSSGGYSELSYTGFDSDSTVKDASENIGDVTAIVFANSGTYDAIAQTVTRGEDGVVQIPDYKTATATFAHKITVKSLAVPVELDTTVPATMASSVVTVTFAEVEFKADDLAANSAAILSAFSLAIENGDYSATVNPTAVAVNGENTAAIDLTFDALYNTDVLKLSYTAPATPSDALKVADGRGIETGAVDGLEIGTNLIENLLTETSDFTADGYDVEAHWNYWNTKRESVIDGVNYTMSLVKASDVDAAASETDMWLEIKSGVELSTLVVIKDKINIKTGNGYYLQIDMYAPSQVKYNYIKALFSRDGGWVDFNDKLNNTATGADCTKDNLGYFNSAINGSVTLKSPALDTNIDHNNRQIFYIQSGVLGTYYIKNIALTNKEVRP